MNVEAKYLLPSGYRHLSIMLANDNGHCINRCQISKSYPYPLQLLQSLVIGMYDKCIKSFGQDNQIVIDYMDDEGCWDTYAKIPADKFVSLFNERFNVNLT